MSLNTEEVQAHQGKAEQYMQLVELWAAELALAVNESPKNQERLNKCSKAISVGLFFLRAHLECKDIGEILKIQPQQETQNKEEEPGDESEKKEHKEPDDEELPVWMSPEEKQ